MTDPTASPEARDVEKKPHNAFALSGLILGVASVFLSFIGIIPILAIVFSGIGLAKVKHRAGRSKVQAWIGLILGILYTMVYMYQSQVPREKAVDQAGARAAFQAQASSISAGDADAIATFIDLPARWNRSAAPLVRDYLDPNVPADRWVKEASTHIGELRAVHVEMHVCTFAIQDPGIKRTFQDIAANYRVKLDCVTALHNAVAAGDQQAEQDAQQALSEASVEGQRLGQALLDRLRPYVDPQVLTDELRKRGKEIGELMKPK